MIKIAIIGAGPVGLSLALQAARALPEAELTVFDARAAEHDVSGDPRTLALSLGSVQTLQRMDVWEAVEANPQVESIQLVHVSQQQPALLNGVLGALLPGARRIPEQPEVTISAQDEAVPRLGVVLSYGTLVAPLQAAWQALQADAPQRLHSRFGVRVRGVKPVPGGVEVDADIAELFDLAVVAEGGVFAEQPRKGWAQGLSSDYGQTAWVGQVRIAAGPEHPRGTAWERFTPQGPAALLPLPPQPGDGPDERRAALVWCVDRDDDPVQQLDESRRLALLNTVFHPRVGRLVEMSALKAFPLGLNAEWRLAQAGVVRIGNAAQTLHPVAGQGLNLGLRDVHELVDALRRERPAPGAGHPLVVADHLSRALRRFEWRRTPDRWALIAATDFLARSFTWPVPALATLRGLGLGALQLATPARARLARSMMFGWR